MLYCLNYNNSAECVNEYTKCSGVHLLAYHIKYLSKSGRCTRLLGLIHGHFVMEGLSTSTLDLQATSPNTDACSVEQVRVRDSQERL